MLEPNQSLEPRITDSIQKCKYGKLARLPFCCYKGQKGRRHKYDPYLQS